MIGWVFSKVADNSSLATELTLHMLHTLGWQLAEKKSYMAACSCFPHCSFAFSGCFVEAFNWLCPFLKQAAPCQSVSRQGFPKSWQKFPALYGRLNCLWSKDQLGHPTWWLPLALYREGTWGYACPPCTECCPPTLLVPLNFWHGIV